MFIATEICDKEAKKTMVAEHIFAALKSLGFEDLIPEVTETYQESQKMQKVNLILI